MLNGLRRAPPDLLVSPGHPLPSMIGHPRHPTAIAAGRKAVHGESSPNRQSCSPLHRIYGQSPRGGGADGTAPSPVPACHGGRDITYRSPTLPHHTSRSLPFTPRSHHRLPPGRAHRILPRYTRITQPPPDHQPRPHPAEPLQTTPLPTGLSVVVPFYSPDQIKTFFNHSLHLRQNPSSSLQHAALSSSCNRPLSLAIRLLYPARRSIPF